VSFPCHNVVAAFEQTASGHCHLPRPTRFVSLPN
jgi:hypothetical protein